MIYFRIRIIFLCGSVKNDRNSVTADLSHTGHANLVILLFPQVAIRADKALMDMFYQGDVLYIEEQGGYIRNRTAQTYDEVVKDLILCDKSYLRDLHMITKVEETMQGSANVSW